MGVRLVAAAAAAGVALGLAVGYVVVGAKVLGCGAGVACVGRNVGAVVKVGAAEETGKAEGTDVVDGRGVGIVVVVGTAVVVGIAVPMMGACVVGAADVVGNTDGDSDVVGAALVVGDMLVGDAVVVGAAVVDGDAVVGADVMPVLLHKSRLMYGIDTEPEAVVPGATVYFFATEGDGLYVSGVGEGEYRYRVPDEDVVGKPCGQLVDVKGTPMVAGVVHEACVCVSGPAPKGDN